MNILILNPILYTAERNIIPNVDSIKDTMIYNMCIGFVALGHNITLCAAEEFRPQKRTVHPMCSGFQNIMLEVVFVE